ncbi:MAG: hypothetical protein J7J06_01895 [Methanosarcinales archaeon]|nr:hypothetical protein [Methanosarcinales archaeon]
MTCCKVNLPGVIAGLLTIALPSLGAWWHLAIGSDAVIVSASPFEMEFLVFGVDMVSPLFRWICVGLKLGVVYTGIVLLTGSLLASSDQYSKTARLLINFGSSKLMYLVAMFTIGLIATTILANQSSDLLPVQAQLPYLVGSETIDVIVEGVHLMIPISMNLAGAFGVAVSAAALGIVSRIYQKRIS